MLRTSLRISAFRLLSNSVSDSTSAVLIKEEDREKVGAEFPTKAVVGTESAKIASAAFLKSIVVVVVDCSGRCEGSKVLYCGQIER